MKRLFSLFLLLFFFYCASAQTSLRFGPTGFAVVDMDYTDFWLHGGPALSIESGFREHWSFNVDFIYGRSPATAYGGTTVAYRRQIFMLRPELRYYFRQALNGPYAGLQAVASFELWDDVHNENNSDWGGYTGPGLTLGICKQFGETVDLNAGLNCAVHIGEFYLLPGATIQVGFRF